MTRARRFGSLLAAAALAVSLAGCAAPPPPAAPPVPPAEPAVEAEPALSELPMPVIRKEQVHSASRGTDTELYLAYPTGLESTENLPVVLYLHGRDGVNPTPIPYDTLASLERLYHEGRIPAFGFVVVDGGYNPYWNDGSANGDLATMLNEELPVWLSERGFGDAEGLPFAAAGISTGGFGALTYAADRNLAGKPVAAVGEVAPALQVSWEGMREKEAFGTEDEWLAVDPLHRLDDLGDVPIGVWTGDTDPFLDGIEQLIDRHRNTPVVTYLPGGHEGAVFEAVGTEFVEFLAGSLQHNQP
ncbi:S-formylglutathione hydrolase FrmB [Saccharopolyspora kobensis]|uniref:S-formylglutathione hydrolase FrmB n=1 Tax=Saccharopolyspora kobensis TaxID=146035 RepID=A0A1H5U1S4_9PSEU|nr:alpha/beta hydrolase-fold protein [Saccharopolyspora kobensis]SEF69054.1 S-formylglutathione hydrolase FrmB [Saccharopolyspora kobensis]SFC78247.1 S-formylglutathione hydrolase FrmB [Saccharopolyspora kobensis]